MVKRLRPPTKALACRKEEQAATQDEIEMDTTPKRQCQAPGCGKDIPKWRNGRHVHEDTKYCFRACAQKARRREGL